MAAEKAVEVGANLVALARLEVMALCASCLEKTGSLLSVTYRVLVDEHADEGASHCSNDQAQRYRLLWDRDPQIYLHPPTALPAQM